MADDGTYLLLYEYVADMGDRRGPYREAHLERIAAERGDGHITDAGAFDPPSGAAIVFAGVSRQHVEDFVAADPYNQAGLITAWRAERWNQV